MPDSGSGSNRGSGSGSSADFIARITSTQATLESVKDTFTNTYMTQVSNGGSLSSQSTGLDDQVITLKAKLAKVKSISDTYDREYLDRMSDKKSSFLRSRGISTLQDWVLLIFFILYTIISLGLVAIVYMTSRYSVFGAFFVAISAVTVGTLIVATIVRFA
jgi:hypothetical protein